MRWLVAGLLLLVALADTGRCTPDAEAIAVDYITERIAPGVTFELRRSYRSAHNGVTHLYFKQQVNGVEVADRDICLHVGAGGEMLTADGILEQLRPLPARRGVMLTAHEALERATEHLQIEPPAGIVPEQRQIFVASNATVRLVWNLHIELPDGSHWWDVHVDAYTGDIVQLSDWVHHCQFRTWHLPAESPSHGPPELRQAYIATNASPFGWHDTNGIPGPEHTDTQGNNARAQEDRDGNNFMGHRPDGGTNLVFSFPFRPHRPPDQNQDAAIAHAFYVNNLAHDIFYQYGFTEAAGNYQKNNYGKGGAANDPVIVDVQDGSSLNNASFSAVPDGLSGRMQLHLWQGFFLDLEIATPAAIAGNYSGSGATFGPAFPTNGLTGQVVAALDPPDPILNSITDGCSALSNATEIAGNIAFIDRGDCFFITKVRNAQAAGAIAVVVANHESDQLVTMNGTAPDIVIPSVFIGKTDGDAVRAQLDLGEEVQITVTSTPRRDAALDSGIIVHEYGHGVSIRLTGGPANANCLAGVQSSAMGEGWSDWFTLAFTHRGNHSRNTPRGVGAYVAGQPGNGQGIRTHPYTANMSINPLTFGDLPTRTGPHARGEIWCAALWDMYWDLVERYGFDPDIYYGRGGNNLAMQLVIDGLRLQPCNPTFLDARDALLLADRINHNGNHQCLIWRCFARRGMGTQALDGGTHNTHAVTENFAVPLGCEEDVEVAIAPEVLDRIMLDWPTVTGAVYEVQETRDLVTGSWSTISGAITAQQATTQFNITNAPGQSRHYRVQLRLEP